jgi:hypothetical protein
MVQRTSGEKWTAGIESAPDGLYVVVNGLRIAKRGAPDTPQAGTWVSLEPGWAAISSPDLEELVVTRDGVRIH